MDQRRKMMDTVVMQSLLLATANRGKRIEIGEALAGLPLQIRSLDDLPKPPPAPAETGATFAENALLKARFYHPYAPGIPVVADDSGIFVAALADELGVHTRRWGAGPLASDEEWIRFFLERMRHEKEKRASFVCTLAYFDGSREEVFEGRCDGVITASLEADYLPGLPISACFRPDGCTHVFSALTTDEKNRVSHRGKATAQLRKFLETIIAS